MLQRLSGTLLLCVATFIGTETAVFAQCSGGSGSGSNAASSGYQPYPLTSLANSSYNQLPARQNGYPAFNGNSNYSQNFLAQAYRNQQALQSRTSAIEYQRQMTLARAAHLRALRSQRRSERIPELNEQESTSEVGKLLSGGTQPKELTALTLGLPK